MRGLTNHFAIALAWVCLLTPSPALFGEDTSPSQHNAPAVGNSRPTPQAPSPYSSVPRGFDTFLKFARTNMGGGCVATLVARIPLAGGACRVAFMTAGHCIQNTTALEVMELTIPGIGPLRIANKPGRLVHFHNDAPLSERTVRYEKRRPNGELVGAEIHELPGGSDFALMHLDLPDCQKNLGYERPAKLAECGSDGRVLLNESEGLTFQKRHSPEGDKSNPNKFNYGGGAHLRLTNMRKFFGRIFPRLDVRGSAGVQFREGDSGAPVWNDRGEMVGVAASSTVENEDLLFDPKAICEAKDQLKKWGMWPPVPDSGSSVPENKPAQVAPQAIADTRAPSGVPVSTAAPAMTNNAAASEIRIDQDAAGKKRLVWQTAGGRAEPIFGRKNQEGSTDWLFKNAAGQWEKLPPAGHAKLADFYRPYADTRARFEQAFGNANDRSLVEGFLKPQWASRPLDSFASIAQPPAAAQPPAVIQPTGQRPGPNVGPVVANVGGSISPKTPAQSQAIASYENMQYWVSDGVYANGKTKLKPIGLRERYHAISPNEFADVPLGGTGKVIVAHFGNPRNDLQQILAAQPKEVRDLIEVRNYPINGPEHKEAMLFKVQTLALDGLGRKISRYPMDASEVLRSFLQGSDGNQELARLKAYRQAKESEASAQAHSPRTSPPPTQSAQDGGLRSRGLSSTNTAASLHSGLTKCASCHSGNAALNPSLKTAEGLKPFLRTMPSDLLSSMIARGPKAGYGLSEAEKSALLEYRAIGSSDAPSTGHLAGVSPAAQSPSDSGARRLASVQSIPACLTGESTRESKIQALPSITDGSPLAERLKQASQGRRLVFYDKDSRPKTWLGTSFGDTVHLKNSANVINRDSFRRLGYHGDSGAREFPWVNPAGTDISPGVSSEKFVIPPDDGASARLVTRTAQNSPSYFGPSRNRRSPQMGWEYRSGATLGEVLKVTNPATGEAIPFEVRLRQKLSNGQWTMDVLRPFENSADLAQSLQRLCEGAYAPAGCAQVNGALAALKAPQAQQVRREAYVNAKTFGTRHNPLAISRTANEALVPVATIQVIPELPADVVAALLKTTPFKSVFGKPWATDARGGNPGWAPSSASNFSIVPKNYFGAFIPTTQEGCMKCHDSAGRHVDQFDPDRRRFFFPDPSDAPRPRTWYNWMQGNDGILSLHPYSTQAIQRGAVPNRNAIDPCLLQAYIFQ